MVRALTKRRPSGELYERPAEVESAIAVALSLDRAELLRRSRIPDSKEPGFLPLECLVHLIRSTQAAGDSDLANVLLDLLFRRVAAILAATLPDSRSPRAADLRQEVIDRLADKFLSDAKPDALDIFEVRFGKALSGLRIDALRPTLAEKAEHVPVAEDADDDDETRSRGAILSAETTPETLLGDAQTLAEVKRAAWALPKKLRLPVVLHYLRGYEIESTDPAKRTVATVCKVSGRTVRTRLAEGLELIKKGVKGK
jgi:DNA-directed RNA polymerase specialized sigma24 family protein